jgi:type VI protein secretion system component Hcp
MRVQHLSGIILIFLSLQLPALCASAAAVMPVVAYATIHGLRQGNFKGSVTTPGYQGMIALVRVQYNQVGEIYNLTIEKYPDASDGQLQQAFSQNEGIADASVTMIKFNKGVPQAYQIYNLEKGKITNISYNNNAEQITFKFAKSDIVFLN